jgi:hypothetical protein
MAHTIVPRSFGVNGVIPKAQPPEISNVLEKRMELAGIRLVFRLQHLTTANSSTSK